MRLPWHCVRHSNGVNYTITGGVVVRSKTVGRAVHLTVSPENEPYVMSVYNNPDSLGPLLINGQYIVHPWHCLNYWVVKDSWVVQPTTAFVRGYYEHLPGWQAHMEKVMRPPG